MAFGRGGKRRTQMEANSTHELPFTTALGYPMDQVVSALQKEIRRGKELEACWWALELMHSGQGARLWRRLGIIAAEEVGLADPAAMQMFASCLALRDVSSYGLGSKNVLCLAVLTLCRAKKTHEVDHLKNILENIRDRNREAKLELPPYAKDRHTAEGRERFRGDEKAGFLDFLYEGQLCANIAGVSPYIDGFVDAVTMQFNLTPAEAKKLRAELKKRGS